MSTELDEVRVTMIFPEHWTGRVKFRLEQSIKLADVEVPPGFTTDGASVPRFLWWFFPPAGKYFKAAAVHDYLLVEKEGWEFSNKIFSVALGQLGIVGWRRALMVKAVQLNGLAQKVKHQLGLGGRHVA